MPKIIAIGDSTVSKFNDVSYYYPRYGYGTMLDKYFNLEVLNLALSGRSSKSYILEKEYETYKESINEGDFIFIGFGHNDEKDDDIARFTSANLPFDDPLSFKRSLYDNYIKIALDKGANPIICTPIPRLDLTKKYEGLEVHDTPNGDYRAAIINLATEKNIPCIDLTTLIKELSIRLGDTQILLHAISKGKKENGQIYFDARSVDKAHLSMLGALFTAYIIAKKSIEYKFKIMDYVKHKIEAPTLYDLKVNPSFVYKDYFTPDLEHYNPKDNFKGVDFIGTAFGELKDPTKFMAYKNDDKYIVGTSEACGKINASQEGYAFLFKNLDKGINFKLSAHAKVLSTLSIKQSGFGIMLRSDCYINQDSPSENYNTNYISAGMLTTDKITYIIFSRENPTELNKGNNTIDCFYKENDELDLEINRLGQVVNTKVSYNGKIYEKEFIDFDFTSVDSKYIYAGMFSTAGTVIEFSDVSLELTGIATEA